MVYVQQRDRLKGFLLRDKLAQDLILRPIACSIFHTVSENGGSNFWQVLALQQGMNSQVSNQWQQQHR